MGSYLKWVIVLIMIIFGQTLHAHEYWIRYSVSEVRERNKEMRKVIGVIELQSKGQGLDLGTLRASHEIAKFLVDSTKDVTGYIYCKWQLQDGKIKSIGIPVFGEFVVFDKKKIKLRDFLKSLKEEGVPASLGEKNKAKDKLHAPPNK